MEGPTDKLIIHAPSGANVGPLSGNLASDKIGIVKNDFAYMPPLEDASDYDRSPSKQGLSTPTSNFPKPGMLRNSPTVMQAKSSKSHSFTTLIDDDHVEVSAPAVVPSPLHPTSPRRAKSTADFKAPMNTPIDGRHVEVSTIVTVPSSSPHTSPWKFRV